MPWINKEFVDTDPHPKPIVKSNYLGVQPFVGDKVMDINTGEDGIIIEIIPSVYNVLGNKTTTEKPYNRYKVRFHPDRQKPDKIYSKTKLYHKDRLEFDLQDAISLLDQLKQQLVEMKDNIGEHYQLMDVFLEEKEKLLKVLTRIK